MRAAQVSPLRVSSSSLLRVDAVSAAEVFVGLAHRAAFAALHRLEAPPDAGDSLGVLQFVDEFLVGGGVLDDELRLAVYRQDLRPAGLLQPPDVRLGVTLKLRQRV